MAKMRRGKENEQKKKLIFLCLHYFEASKVSQKYFKLFPATTRNINKTKKNKMATKNIYKKNKNKVNGKEEKSIFITIENDDIEGSVII